MDAFTMRPVSRLLQPPGFEPSQSDGAAAIMHTNPFSFGLDIALPPPASFGPFSGGGPVHALPRDSFGFSLDIALPPPASFGSFSSGGPVHALHGNPFSFGFDAFSGGAAVHALYTNPFSFGCECDFGLARPPLTGYDPFSGGATVHGHEHSNPLPFTVDRWDDNLPLPAAFGPFSAGADTHTWPTNLEDYVPAADSLRTPVYGSNPFNADGGAARSMEVLAPWESGVYNGHLQPAVDEPVSVSPQLIPAPAVPVCSSYDDDIEATLRAQEEDVKARPSPDYLETTQGGRMSPEMRSSLVCWMIEIIQTYDLGPATLHRAVSYADRFLSARPLADVSPHRLNLLGAAAVFAAAKYEDQGTKNKLDARELARYGGFAGSQEVVDMERALLAALDYRLGGPTAHTFVEHFTRGYSSSSSEEEDELQFRAHDLANVSLLHYGCLELRPSAVAAAAMFLARLTQKPSYGQMMSWNRELKELTGYKPKDLEHGVDAIRSLIPKDDGNGFDIVDIFPVFYADPD